jgi:hypothetical protein
MDEIKSKTIQNYISSWQEKIIFKPKLRFYNKFKQVPITESYVSLNLSPIERSYLAQLRLGILPIEVETGRYKSIPLENRICKLCELANVEDEMHILLICPQYTDLTNIWKNKFKMFVPNLDNLDIGELLNVIFIYPRITAKYVVNIIEKRKEKLFML